MSDPVAPVVEQSLAQYMREENAKELREERGDLDPVEASAPDSKPAPTALAADAVAGESAAVSETSAETPAEAKPDDAERNADGTFKPKRKQTSNTGEWVRNQKLANELKAAQEELTRLRAQPAVQPAPAPAPPVSDPNDPEPTIDKFLDKADPYAALAVEAAKWAVREDRRMMAQAAQAQTQREAAAEVMSRVEAFIETHPDYPEKVDAIKDLQFPREVLNAIADDELGPAVAYHLASHPDEAQRIALLTPVGGVKAIGMLISRLSPVASGSGGPAVSTSKAKPLIKPVSGSPVAPDARPPDDLPFGKNYIAQMNAKERREREALRG